jgi:hypothetical protein
MKSEVRLAAGFGVVERIDQRIEESRDGLQIALGGAFAGQPDGLALDGDSRLQDVVQDVGLGGEAQGERLAQHRGVGTAHERAATVLDVEQPQHRERAQRFAQHRSTDPQRQRQLALGQQAVASLQCARQQLVAKEDEDALGAARRLSQFRSHNLQRRHVISWSVRGLTRIKCHRKDATQKQRKAFLWTCGGK